MTLPVIQAAARLSWRPFRAAAWALPPVV